MVDITDTGTTTATSRLSNDASNFFTSDALLQRTFGYNTNGQCFENNETNANGGTSNSYARVAGRATLSVSFIYALALFLVLTI